MFGAAMQWHVLLGYVHVLIYDVCNAGIQRPAFTSRPGLADQSHQQQLSNGAADSVWQEPPIVFHGADDNMSASTPAKLGQLMKKGIVKFKEVLLVEKDGTAGHNHWVLDDAHLTQICIELLFCDRNKCVCASSVDVDQQSLPARVLCDTVTDCAKISRKRPCYC